MDILDIVFMRKRRKEMVKMHEEKEKRGKEQFEGLGNKKNDLDEYSFVEGFIYGTIDAERRKGKS